MVLKNYIVFKNASRLARETICYYCYGSFCKRIKASFYFIFRYQPSDSTYQFRHQLFCVGYPKVFFRICFNFCSVNALKVCPSDRKV